MPQPFLLVILTSLSLLVACVPKTVESSQMTDEQITQNQTTSVCSLELDFSEAFQQTGKSIKEAEAIYQIILRDPLRTLIRESQSQLETNGWVFTEAKPSSRDSNSHEAAYTCPENDQALTLSIKPRGRSLIYDVKLTLELPG